MVRGGGGKAGTARGWGLGAGDGGSPGARASAGGLFGTEVSSNGRPWGLAAGAWKMRKEAKETKDRQFRISLGTEPESTSSEVDEPGDETLAQTIKPRQTNWSVVPRPPGPRGL